MSLILPTLTDGTENYDLRTQLEGTDYLFLFRYTLRRELWTFSIQSPDGTDILSGQAVHVGIPLNRRAIGGPPGLFFAISETDDLTSPGFDELGSRVKLCYLTAAEVTALAAGLG